MSNETIDRELTTIGTTLRAQPSLRGEVMRRVTQASLATPRPSLLRRRWGAIGALAACLLIGVMIMVLQGGDRASEAFAQAIAQVGKARTFSCLQMSQSIEKDGKLETHEAAYMFKEPDRSRWEHHAGLGMDGQVTITDFAKHRQLRLDTQNKTADLMDTSTMYEVDHQTGELHPASLDTDVREEVLKLAAESVKDLGRTQLNGRTVRVLQSTGKKSGSVRTVYVDPDTNLPVQIVIEWPKSAGSKWTYADIRIDQDLDDGLFSLEIPADYQRFTKEAHVPAPEHVSKMMIKMRVLLLKCIEYANDHNGEYPAELKDLTKTTGDGKVSEKALKALLAAPEQSDGPAVIVYRRPPKGVTETGTQIVLYEVPEVRADHKVAVGLMDGHGEVMTEEYFNALMSKQK